MPKSLLQTLKQEQRVKKAKQHNRHKTSSVPEPAESPDLSEDELADQSESDDENDKDDMIGRDSGDESEEDLLVPRTDEDDAVPSDWEEEESRLTRQERQKYVAGRLADQRYDARMQEIYFKYGTPVDLQRPGDPEIDMSIGAPMDDAESKGARWKYVVDNLHGDLKLRTSGKRSSFHQLQEDQYPHYANKLKTCNDDDFESLSENEIEARDSERDAYMARNLTRVYDERGKRFGQKYIRRQTANAAKGKEAVAFEHHVPTPMKSMSTDENIETDLRRPLKRREIKKAALLREGFTENEMSLMDVETDVELEKARKEADARVAKRKLERERKKQAKQDALVAAAEKDAEERHLARTESMNP